MTDETYKENLLRAAVAHLTLLNGMTAAREMFQKSYFALGSGEKVAVDQAVFGMVAANYQNLTPEYLAAAKPAPPVGFVQSTDPK